MAQVRARTPAQSVVFDTDVLIWYFRGSQAARRFLTGFPYSQRTISALSMMELLQGCRDRDETGRVKAFAAENLSAILHPDAFISKAAMALLEQHARSDGLRVVDALIAATALESGGALATANLRHYRFIARLELIPFRPGP